MLLSALAMAVTMLDTCSWDKPGASPYRGRDIAAAIDTYRDIPPEQRADLKVKLAKLQYDDVAEIRRDSITSEKFADKYTYSDLTFMHGGGTPVKVCRTVSRAKWTDSMVERGLVFCSAVGASGRESCVIVPTVCNNVSRITRTGKPPVAVAPPPSSEAPPAFPPTYVDVPVGGGTTPPVDLPPTITVAEAPPPTFVNQIDPPPPWHLIPPPAVTVPIQPTGPGVVIPRPPVIVPPTTPIPEPESYALMLAGLAVIAFVSRRKQWKQD